ncbi:hypothetical protein BD324DRAFT_651014 [Kockovaella imperatae]|uniref:Uncharacterized protein n=1 Tax=Kockovaella imperatae TaxID=4999 RepID=A0A1Y1UH82_9TREE|nr:hypothetical protein BD324DRAFT_651014 [Kockovaella imperatae]ORX37420.1 hypothetical protein BD324DRAFT_651014 [Kockovaella imperatae]
MKLVGYTWGRPGESGKVEVLGSEADIANFWTETRLPSDLRVALSAKTGTRDPLRSMASLAPGPRSALTDLVLPQFLNESGEVTRPFKWAASPSVHFPDLSDMTWPGHLGQSLLSGFGGMGRTSIFNDDDDDDFFGPMSIFNNFPPIRPFQGSYMPTQTTNVSERAPKSQQSPSDTTSKIRTIIEALRDPQVLAAVLSALTSGTDRATSPSYKGPDITGPRVVDVTDMEEDSDQSETREVRTAGSDTIPGQWEQVSEVQAYQHTDEAGTAAVEPYRLARGVQDTRTSSGMTASSPTIPRSLLTSDVADATENSTVPRTIRTGSSSGGLSS